MSHVFVESNWLFAYAAPAHHHVPAAAALLDRARQGEFTLHMPNICIGEARQAILKKCHPRHEADAIREFLSWSESEGSVTSKDAQVTRTVLDRFESSVKYDLANLDRKFQELSDLTCLEIFSFDDLMLERAITLALEGVTAKPFDHAILAGFLVRASRLWDEGERAISFCELDAHLQP